MEEEDGSKGQMDQLLKSLQNLLMTLGKDGTDHSRVNGT